MVSKEEVLKFHSKNKAGKIEISLTKKIENANDLSIAYSPGVAFPCLEIQKNPDLAYDYTCKANTVAIISNGTAVLGLGDIGSLAGKPVMEGKAALMKAFAGVDGVDIEVETKDVDEFVTVVKNIGRTFGGINLEDIKAPECFEIEKRLQEELDIPVFHDDQHGTAIVVAAGLLNACEIAGKKLCETKIVVSGAGAAALACCNLLLKFGVLKNNITICDSKGVVYKGRENINKYKEVFAKDTKDRTLSDAVKNSDIFLGMSSAGVLSKEMVKTMAENPIIFALANPNPEILPEEAKLARNDVIVATGRSDYPNQVNNVLCFPYLFRVALDMRAKRITDEMQINAVRALSELAREEVIDDDLKKAYPNREFNFGREYFLPLPFDKRLLEQFRKFVK
jgi:malate dehydrogenase (oxaloacetate-decarboxylating)(NADP+)